MWCNRMLPDFCFVAIGSWPVMKEYLEVEDRGGQGLILAVAP
jgi:hypothetical protein